MKNILKIIILLIGININAQEVVISLAQMEECVKRPNHDTEGCPDLQDATYVKDVNNRLDQFVGVWKGSYGGKNYEFHFTKKLKDSQWELKWDYIIGRFQVKDNAGNIIYTSLNKADGSTMFSGDNFQNNVYLMNFVGNYDCLESGTVYIETLPNNLNQMTLDYSQDNDGIITSPSQCPNFSSFVPLLPYDKMTLTKQ